MKIRQNADDGTLWCIVDENGHAVEFDNSGEVFYYRSEDEAFEALKRLTPNAAVSRGARRNERSPAVEPRLHGTVRTRVSTEMNMTDDQLLKWAEEADVIGVGIDEAADVLPYLRRFAEAVAVAEREACAKIAEEEEVPQFEYCMVVHDDGSKLQRNIAAAIRARSN